MTAAYQRVRRLVGETRWEELEQPTAEGPRFSVAKTRTSTMSAIGESLFRLVGNEATVIQSSDTGPHNPDLPVSPGASVKRFRADAMLSPVGMFLLQEVAARDGGVPLEELAGYVEAAEVWLIIARLIRAGLLDENGLSVYATQAGRDAAATTLALTDEIGRE